MYETPLSRRLGALRTWQQARLRLLEKLQPWLRSQGLENTEARRAIERAIDTLQDDHVTIAVTGEFSRGKTELLNALFFADLGYRLLPTDAGRTTMCPTEIFHDPDQPSQLRLLPIETRGEKASLSALRKDRSRWQTFSLQLDDPQALAATLRKLTEQQQVDYDTALQLGLNDDRTAPSARVVSIPRWRLAELNIPHPLLERGLRVLDTPGLNTVGSEPELTYELLPTAHAVLFILGADTGVTLSDMEIWQRFVRGPAQSRRRGLAVVLNKTDTLWDELRAPGEITESIVNQCRGVAETLDVEHAQIFAISAQKALLARVQGNPALETRSGITGLERHLGKALADNRSRLVKETYSRHVMQAVTNLDSLVQSRLQRNATQRSTLRDLASRSDTAIANMLRAAQADFDRYQSNVDTHKRRLRRFYAHARRLLAALDRDALENSLNDIHDSMTGAWTTLGLRDAMGTLFEHLNRRVATAGAEAQMMRRVLRSTYRHFEKEYQVKLPSPTMLSLVRHQVELSMIDREAEVFRNSPRTTLMEQHFVTRRYFETIVSRVRTFVSLAHDEASTWTETVMSPLSIEIKVQRSELAQRIADLQATSMSRKTIQQRINLLRREHSKLQSQLESLQRLRNTLIECEPMPADRASGQN